MPLPARPASHIDWTDGNALKQTEPTSGKKLLGWTKSERPPFQYMNFLFYNLDLWIKWAEDSIDDHETRLVAAEGSIASLGTAASISASPTGHTYLTGANVQLQLNQTDDFLEDLANAITQGKGADIVGFIMGAPANWSPSVDHVGDALDQLAARVNTLENLANTGEYIEASFNDYVAAASTNTGLTDNANTNPRGLKFNDLKYIEGEEIIHVTALGFTGNYDANGLPEYEITSPKRDPRVRFYGSWETYQDRNGRRALANDRTDESNYMLVTGVFDSLALEVLNFVSSVADDIDVLVDNVDTGTNLSFRSSSVLSTQDGRQCKSLLSDPSLTGLGMGLHTAKFTFGASDSSNQASIFGIRLIGTARYQLGGQAWVEKNLSSAFSVSTPAAATVTNKGGRVLRYIDPADTTLKYAVQNCTVLETTASSIGSGAGSIVVTSATGFAAGNLVLLTDGPNNSELIRVSSVNIGLNTLSFATNTQNSYTNATVALWGSTGAGVVHTNEEAVRDATPDAFGEHGLWGGLNDIASIGPGGGVVQISGHSDDNVHAFNLSDHQYNAQANFAYNGVSPGADTQALAIRFVGTGIDLLLSVGTVAATTRFILDGVELGPVSLTADRAQWYKIASDLPEGSHVLQFENDTGAAGVSFVRTRLYRTKRPTVACAEGNILADKLKTATPLFIFSKAGLSSPRLSVSRGCISEGMQSFHFTAEGTGGSGDWAQNALIPQHHTLDGGDSATIYSDRTNASIKKWFYGTGVTISGVMTGDRGIAQLKLNGSNMTTSNFGSATFHAPSGAGFNATSGQWDAYSATLKTGKFGISGLTEGWHFVEVLGTGTKNGSSSAYTIEIIRFELLGNDKQFAPIYGRWSSSFSQYSGVKDVRKLAPSVQLELAEARFMQRFGVIAGPGVSTSGLPIWEMQCYGVETKPGEALLIKHHISVQKATAGQSSYIDIYIDGENVTGGAGLDLGAIASGGAANQQMNMSKELLVPVPPGFHDVKLIYGKGSGTDVFVQSRRSMMVEPVSAVRSA